MRERWFEPMLRVVAGIPEDKEQTAPALGEQLAAFLDQAAPDSRSLGGWDDCEWSKD